MFPVLMIFHLSLSLNVIFSPFFSSSLMNLFLSLIMCLNQPLSRNHLSVVDFALKQVYKTQICYGTIISFGSLHVRRCYFLDPYKIFILDNTSIWTSTTCIVNFITVCTCIISNEHVMIISRIIHFSHIMIIARFIIVVVISIIPRDISSIITHFRIVMNI